MKTIIAVNFFGILTYAFGELNNEIGETDENINLESHLSSPLCKKTPMANFNLTAYLQMTPTYRTYARRDSGSNTYCRVLNTERKACDSVKIDIYGYYTVREKIYYSETIYNIKEKSMKTGEYWADCELLKATYADTEEYKKEYLQDQISNDLETNTSEFPYKFQQYMSVMDTDYKNYAIIYLCEDYGDEYAANIEVVQTSAVGCENAIKEALLKVGEKFEDYIPMNATYCMIHGKQGTTRKEVETNEIEAKK